MECQFHAPGVTQQLLSALGVKYRKAPRLIKEVALNSKHKDFADHDKIVLKLLSPHLIQAYRNAQTITSHAAETDLG